MGAGAVAGTGSAEGQKLSHVRLIAVNIDGVLLNDSFGPVIRRLVESRGGVYGPELEQALLSQSQMVAARAAAEVLGGSAEALLAAYFEERERYVAEHPVRVLPGARELLERLRGLGASTVCYGGLERKHFDRYLGDLELAGLFDEPGYVCTNDFRPGIREITEDVFGLRLDQVMFIDDVARVAEAARDLGVAFIGHPSDYESGFQRPLMERAGARHVVRSLGEIDEELLLRVDAEAAAGRSWPGRGV
ncbi:HAD family phosphatase [Streptomyces sp. SID335]|nr:HAD family phosphatase [Streptomyces sp. SID335]NDZ86791.1 HAD family phosphatase [Streptomyces sp. SID10115]NDZ98707.1 HAD family phosphatase [Streptomyces sp. SID10116]NEB46849.1 HAD family phosphatase [Streptomyces sp. SID339]